MNGTDSALKDPNICSEYGFCIVMSEGIIDLRLIIMLLVGIS